MKLRDEEFVISDLIRRKELGYLIFHDENSLPSQDEQNKILENLLLGIPLCLKGVRSKNGKIHVLDTEFNVISYFLNGNINFTSSIYTGGYPFDRTQIDSNLLPRINSIKINFLTFHVKDDSKIIQSFFNNKYSLDEINEMKSIK